MSAGRAEGGFIEVLDTRDRQARRGPHYRLTGPPTTAAHHVHGLLLASREGAQDLVYDAIVDDRMECGGRFHGILGTARRTGPDGAAFSHYRAPPTQPANSALPGS